MHISIDMDPVAALLFGEDGPGRERERRLVRCLERYKLILDRVRPDFAPAEWALLVEAWAATVAEPASVVEELADTVEDAARGWDLGRAHGVDTPALVARLRRLGLAQTVAVVERLEAEGAARRAERDRAEAKVVAFPRRPHPSTRPTVR